MMSIKDIDLEHFSTTDHETSSSFLHSRTHHAEFHWFQLDNRKEDAATTSAHSKLITEFLKKVNI